MPIELTRDQETLKRLIKRRHPEYDASLPHWDFLEETYDGGRDWFEDHIFRYVKEGDKEFEQRKLRAYRFNHTREAVDLVQKYIFKGKIVRNHKDASAEIKAFWENATLSGLDIGQFMRLVSTQASIFGMIWLFTDTTSTQNILSKADEKEANVRAYAYIKKPKHVLDFAFDDLGQLLWILTYEVVRDDQDPLDSSGKVGERYRLWTRNYWALFEEIDAGNRGTVIRVIDANSHDFGRVPAFPVAHVIGEHKYKAPGLIDDIAYLDRACANYLSNLDAIIQDQTFSQLAMPAQATLPGDEKYNQLIEAGTKRIFLYDGEGGEPKYISPDPKQAGVILEVINKIIAEIYHTIGMAGERTKQDNAVGIDNSSGVAKAYDFERVNALLSAKATSLENAENMLVEFVEAWHSRGKPETELVKYPETFDVRSLFDEFTIAEKLSLVDAPEGVRREQMKQVIEKLFPRLAHDLKDALMNEIKSWPSKPELEPVGAPSKFGASKAPSASRQGQVTKDTK